MRFAFSRTTVLAAAGVLALALAGCGQSSSPTRPGATIDQATADDIAVQTVVTTALVSGDVDAAVGSMAPTSQARPGASAFATMWDTTFTKDGITFSASRTFYDALGGTLPGYGPLAVRMQWQSRAYGTLSTLRDTATVGHQADISFRGIQPAQDTLKIDGAQSDTLLNRFRSLDSLRTRYFHWISGMTLADVRVLKSTIASGGHPLSGTLTYAVEADRLRSNSVTDVEAHISATVVITFNGTSHPDITVNGTWHYTWDMDTGAVTRV